jgi:serine/threonine protein kinase
LKPANVLLTKSGVKVLDFGLAKIGRAQGVTAGSESITRAPTQRGTILGTLQYMAPEQLQAKEDADSRADIFSFGCVFYEMLTGRRAFDGENQRPHKGIIRSRSAAKRHPRISRVQNSFSSISFWTGCERSEPLSASVNSYGKAAGHHV